MTKRRYILLSIPLTCIVCIIVSLVISQPRKEKKDQRADPASKEDFSARKEAQNINSNDKLIQTVEGLSIPKYDEQGNETLIMRGKNTFLLNNNVYKIVEPEIEFLDSANPEHGTQSIFITSDNGEMNNISNEGYLSDNVIVNLDRETKLNTNYLRYSPEKKSVYTDDFVTITGKGIMIKGQGCEIDLINKKMWIKKDAEMEMDGANNDLFFLSEEDTSQNVQTLPEDTPSVNETSEEKILHEKTFIRSSGQLVFNRHSDTNVMVFHNSVEVKKGSSTVFSDELVIFVDSETKKTKQAIASGNVLASQETTIAKGSSLTWNVSTQTATLEDAYKAEFIKDDLHIDAQKMIFYKDAGKIDIPGSGNLKANTKRKSDKKNTSGNADKTDDTITVKWEGKMNFLEETREANFEKNIEVRKENSILFCNNLNVTFSDRDFHLNTLKATENIHIIDKKSNLYSEAIGDVVTWNVKSKITVLKGRPFALLREGDKRQIHSPKVLFYGNENNILCEGKGTFYEKGDEALSHKGTEDVDIKVNWVKKMVYNSKLKKASFFEQVQATRGEQKLNGDQIDAYMNDKKSVSKIVATDNVYFFSKNLNNSEGLGTLLIWDLIQNVALLTGNPKAELRKEGARTFSEKIYFDIDGNHITWEGRPHWQLITNK